MSGRRGGAAGAAKLAALGRFGLIWGFKLRRDIR